MKKKMNKKGLVDKIYLIAILFSIVIGLMLVHLITTRIYETGKLQGDNPEANQVMNRLNDSFLQRFDYIILAVFIGSFIAMIGLSLFLRTSPLFFVFGILIIMVDTLLAWMWKQAYVKFSEKAAMLSTTASFPFSNWLMLNLPLVSCVMGFVIMIILYGLAARVDQQ